MDNTKQTVATIRKLYLDGYAPKNIAKNYPDISLSTIYRIVNNQVYADTEYAKELPDKRSRLTDTMTAIVAMKSAKMSDKFIETILGSEVLISTASISKLIDRVVAKRSNKK